MNALEYKRQNLLAADSSTILSLLNEERRTIRLLSEIDTHKYIFVEDYLQHFIEVLVSQNSSICHAVLTLGKIKFSSENEEWVDSTKTLIFDYLKEEKGYLTIGYSISQPSLEKYFPQEQFLKVIVNILITNILLFKTKKDFDKVSLKYQNLISAGNSIEGFSASSVFQRILNNSCLNLATFLFPLLSLNNEQLIPKAWAGNIRFDEKASYIFHVDNTHIFKGYALKNIHEKLSLVSMQKTSFSDLGLDSLKSALIDEILGLLIIPLELRETFIGALIIGYDSEEKFDPDLSDLILTYSNQLAVATNLSKSIEEKTLNEARNRFLYKLHGSVIQTLYSANLLVSENEDSIISNEDVNQKQSKLRKLIKSALIETTMLQFDLRPEELDRLRMITVVENICEIFKSQTGIAVEIRLNGDLDLCMEVKEYYYYILREFIE